MEDQKIDLIALKNLYALMEQRMKPANPTLGRVLGEPSATKRYAKRSKNCRKMANASRKINRRK